MASDQKHPVAVAPTESIYKYFDDAWQVVKLLMKHFEGKSPPPEIQKYVQQIPELETQSIDYIKNEVVQYTESHDSTTDLATTIKMCDGMSLVERFPLGRQCIVAEV